MGDWRPVMGRERLVSARTNKRHYHRGILLLFPGQCVVSSIPFLHGASLKAPGTPPVPAFRSMLVLVHNVTHYFLALADAIRMAHWSTVANLWALFVLVANASQIMIIISALQHCSVK